MKKLVLTMITIIAVSLITACVQPVSEVDSFTLSGWTMKDYYDTEDEDALWEDGVELNVQYRDGTSESLDLDESVNDGIVTLTGDYEEDPLGLDTGDPGYYSVTISIDNVSLDFSYYVFDLENARFVGDGENDYDTITEALDGVADGTTIIVEEGTYSETLRMNDMTDLTIFGESEEGVILDASDLDGQVFEMSGGTNFSLINMTVRDDFTGEDKSEWNFKIRGGTEGVFLKNITIEGPGKEYQLGENGSRESITEDNYSWANLIAGLDMHTVTDATLENVTVTGVSRNAMAFSTVTGLNLIDFNVYQTGTVQGSGSAAIALYTATNSTIPTTVIEMTGSISGAPIGINYSVPPFEGFEYGDVAIESTNVPLFLPYDEDDSDEAIQFANRVTGTPWQVHFSSGEGSGLAYYATEAEANSFADLFPDGSATVENIAE
ncbi:MAG: hypothetical protein ACLFSU_00905 [Acholeplasmataceae bacterium]